MPTLVEQLGKEPLRAQVIADCGELIDAAVKQKGFAAADAQESVTLLVFCE